MIRLLVADDHPIVRSGIRHLLRDAEDIRVAAEAATAGDVLREVAAREFDAILLDLTFPDGSGFDVLRALRERNLRVPVIVFTNAIDGEERCVEEGAGAFVSKDACLDELRSAIHAVVSGKRFIGSRRARHVDHSQAAEPSPALPHLSLSPRELDVMLRLVRGMRPKEIACELSISEKTVATHRARLMRKLQVSDTRQLLLYALKTGLTDWS